MIGSPGSRMAKAVAFAAIAGLSALLGFAVASWRYAQTAERDALRSRKMQAELRCARYWANRSGAADAEYQFNRGRRSLLEVVGAVDPSIDYVVPGLRKGEAVGRTRNIGLLGPRLDDLGVAARQLSLSSLCGP